MTFSELESLVRDLIARAETKKAISALNNFFKDTDSLNQIALLSASYYEIVNKQMEGVSDNHEEIGIRKLWLNILEFIKVKKEDLKYREQTFGKKEIVIDKDKDYVKAFFSLGTPHNDYQQAYVQKLTAFMKDEGILLETLTDWNERDPMEPIIKEIKKSNGCLVLALERFYVKSGATKRGSEQQQEVTEKGYTSTWLHIEAAIARSFNIPLLILKEESLQSDGLIHNDKQHKNIALIHEQKVEEIYEHSTMRSLLIWINEVKNYKKTKGNK